MNQLCIDVIASTAYKIIDYKFGENLEEEHRCFRIKNLCKSEIISFLNVWGLLCAKDGLSDVRVIVAADSDLDYPEDFRAQNDRSITWYRNNNDKGLVYIETKTESDEQGLKNIFTLHDRNFLDGSFDSDERDGFSVARTIVENSWIAVGGTKINLSKLFVDRIIDALRYLHPEFLSIPVRNFVNFSVAVCSARFSISESLPINEIDKLIGTHLVELNLFPDECWREDSTESRIKRRLQLNSLYADLVTSSNADIEPDYVNQACARISFVDEQGAVYSSDDQIRWKNLCLEYSNNRNAHIRKEIPYRIFAQLFAKDLKGLKLGDRVELEIESKDPERLIEFTELNVKAGLNSRIQEDAQTFLEKEPPEGELSLCELLTKQTRKMVEKVANPTPERFLNPLTKLAEIAKDFIDGYGREVGNQNEIRPGKIEIRLGRTENKLSPSIGLFSFIYGASLRSLAEQSLMSSGGLELAVAPHLTDHIEPPKLKGNSEDEEDLYEWSPVPIEFVLISKDNEELETSANHEWLPDNYQYLALLWYMLAANDAPEFTEYIVLEEDTGLIEWLARISSRELPLNNNCKSMNAELVESTPLISELKGCYDIFHSATSSHGLSKELINELTDRWDDILKRVKIDIVPDGRTDERLLFFLLRDMVASNAGNSMLMMPSHPIRLKWIASYLAETESLALKALSGELRLNEQNDKLYLKWISGLSPHQQPPIACSANRIMLFASGEQGWCEEFTPLQSKTTSVDASVLDYASVIEMSNQVRSYLDAHPYKQDGLKILLVLQRGGKIAAEIIKEIRKGDYKESKIIIHVLAPLKLWEQIVKYIEEIPTDNRISEGNRYFPPLQLQLHDFEDESSLREVASEHSFDVALVPSLLGEQVLSQHNTEPDLERTGTFDPLLDRPTCVYGGEHGGEISVSMIPRSPGQMLYSWSTLAVRHQRSSPVSRQAPQNTDFIELKIGFQDTAKLYEELHKISHWVVMLERYLRREQIEKLEPQPDILTVKDSVGANGLYTLIVSSNSGRKFIINRLKRKLIKISSNGLDRFSDNEALVLATNIYDKTRKISPRLVLQAMGISRVTEEILGLMIAVELADRLEPTQPENGVVVWISLDENPEWFSNNSSIRADLCRITLENKNDQIFVDILVVEGKFRQAYDPHGVDQVDATINLFKDIMHPQGGDETPLDAKLWREHILSAMENVSPDARRIIGTSSQVFEGNRYRLPENIRSEFRDGNFILRSMKGFYSICCYCDDSQLIQSTERNSEIQIVRSFRGQIKDLISGSHGEIIAKSEAEVSVSKIEPSISNAEMLPPTTKTSTQSKLSDEQLIIRYQMILDKFAEFGIQVRQPEDRNYRYFEGPASILYRLMPGQAVDPRRLYEKADVLKLALALEQDQNIRFGNHKGYIEIDVPKHQEERYYIDANDMWDKWERPANELCAPLGEDSYGDVVSINFSSSNSPHLLIGGTTGSGKSEALNTLLQGLAKFYSPQELRLLLVDPKGTELQYFNDSEHLEGTIGWEDSDAKDLLARAVEEMQSRYIKLRENATRTLPEYNQKVSPEYRIPWWIVVLDEYADLTSDKDNKKEIENHLKRLAQKARAAGIHVIIATQKPSAEVISTNLRSNLPAQLALRVKSATESRVIIDDAGAETLNGKGDALLKAEGKLKRVQCAKI